VLVPVLSPTLTHSVPSSSASIEPIVWIRSAAGMQSTSSAGEGQGASASRPRITVSPAARSKLGPGPSVTRVSRAVLGPSGMAGSASWV
jgi:hypothetical protein